MTADYVKGKKQRPQFMLAVWLGVGVIFVWSAIRPHDYFTWILEVFPAIIGAAALAATYHRFRFTPLLYILIALHMIILMVGGHYTYAEVQSETGSATTLVWLEITTTGLGILRRDLFRR